MAGPAEWFRSFVSFKMVHIIGSQGVLSLSFRFLVLFGLLFGRLYYLVKFSFVLVGLVHYSLHVIETFQWTNSEILNFILVCEAWGTKIKEIILRLSNE